MYYRRLLYEYEKKISKMKISWKERTDEEKKGFIMVIVSGLFLFVLTICSVKNTSVWMGVLTLMSYIALIASIIYCEVYYRSYDEEKMERYNRRLEAVKEILLDSQYKYYTVYHIEKIIEWCDKYSQEEDTWVYLFRPFGTFTAVVFMPAVIVLLDHFVDKTENWSRMIGIGIIFVLIAFALFLFWYAFGNEIKNKLNRKRTLAKQFAEDLRNLSLKEPKIPESMNHKS